MRHRMIEEKHRGHDLMHAEMILILFAAIMAAQVLLFLWRQKHRRSYTVRSPVTVAVFSGLQGPSTPAYVTYVIFLHSIKNGACNEAIANIFYVSVIDTQ